MHLTHTFWNQQFRIFKVNSRHRFMLVKIMDELVEIVGENPYCTSNDHAKILNNTVLDPMTPSNGQDRADID